MDFKERYHFDPAKDLIGKGGFSKVFKAYDNIRKKNVALKFYYGAFSDKYDIISEINRMEDIIHPNLIRYFDADILTSINSIGEKEMTQVGIMEYADGGDIGKLFGLKDLSLYKSIITDVVKGLAFLHQNGIVHRDLKPKNILLVTSGNNITAKICDFGISKRVGEEDHSASSQILGSVEYMAPEQFNPKKYGINGSIDTNVDLWSLGIIIYELLTNQTPFGNRSTGLTNEQILTNILFNEIKSSVPGMPEPFKEIVIRCLVRNASERVRIANELLDILEGKSVEKVVIQPINETVDNSKTEIINPQHIPNRVVINEVKDLKPELPMESSGENALAKNIPLPTASSKDTLILSSSNELAEKIESKKLVVSPSLPSLPTKNNEPKVLQYPVVNKQAIHISDKSKNERDTGKKYFEQKNYVQSFSLLNPLLEAGELDTASKFFLGYMYYNGKCGGAHNLVLGKELMDAAKLENHTLVVDLMLKFVLEGYKKN